MKKKSTLGSSFFALKIGTFWAFFQHVWNCRTPVSVSLNFEKSGLQTFPTKLPKNHLQVIMTNHPSQDPSPCLSMQYATFITPFYLKQRSDQLLALPEPKRLILLIMQKVGTSTTTRNVGLMCPKKTIQLSMISFNASRTSSQCSTIWKLPTPPLTQSIYCSLLAPEATPCYAQLCLPWIPGNASLWIPMPPVSLYFSDVRFTTWTYPSHSLADMWFNACYIASHAALFYTHILIVLK